MGRTSRRSAKTRRRTKGSRGPSRLTRAIAGLRALLLGTSLLVVGFLAGSFWREWRHATLPDQVAVDPAPEPAAPRVKIEVLNGTGERGVAQRVADRLLELGFDVVAVDNADQFGHAWTHVLDRSGREDGARLVAVGLGTDSVERAIDHDLHLDASVIVGDDWRVLLGATARR